MSPGTLEIRNATLEDTPAIVRMNDAAVSVTSPMDEDRLRDLLKVCSLAIVVELDGLVAGFLLAVGEKSSYNNSNYRWFASRLRGFVYIDRIVVDESNRGAGLGRALYDHLCRWALDRRLLQLAAEIDVEPPNPASLEFHDRQGFVELGTRILKNLKKVSMRVKPLVD